MSDNKPTIEYATPHRSPPTTTGIGVLLGTLLAIFSLLMLFYALIVAVYVVRYDFIQHLGGVNLASDCFEEALLFTIATFSGLVSLRWLRGPRRTPRR
jgi:hypothetical protein